MKGYKVDTDTYIEVDEGELERPRPDSTHSIEIDELSPAPTSTPLLIRPYYLVPDGKVAMTPFAVIRETIRSMDKVAIGRVVADQPRASSR